MHKKSQISTITIDKNEFLQCFDKEGNFVKITRRQRELLLKYDYDSIINHATFQDDVRSNIGNGKRLIDDSFVVMKEGKIIYESI